MKEKLSSLQEYEGMTRAEFEAAVEPLVDRTIKICEAAIRDCGLEKAEIEGVVMVGGSTRVPLVQQKVEEFFGRAPLNDINPDEVVALGAAIQAEALTKGSDNLLLDVIPLSLGLETMHGIVEKIIYRNTPIPCSYAQEFTTFQNNQTGMQIHVVQGEREAVQDCRSLARFEVTGIPPAPAGVAKVRVVFTVDADGLLTVSAGDQKVEVKPSYGLTEKEIGQMIRDSMEHGKEDMDGRLLSEAKLEAERLLVSLTPALEKYGIVDKKVNSGIDALKKAMQGNNREEIDRLREELNHATEIIAEKIMNEGIATALKGKTVNEV